LYFFKHVNKFVDGNKYSQDPHLKHDINWAPGWLSQLSVRLLILAQGGGIKPRHHPGWSQFGILSPSSSAPPPPPGSEHTFSLFLSKKKKKTTNTI